MSEKKKTRFTTVREHPRHVPPSEKNPGGVTIVDRHARRLPGTYLDPEEIEKIYAGYNRQGIKFPSSGKLNEYRDADKYDELIAVWTDYFNKKFALNPPLDPDMVKALIASESGFRLDPRENPKAIGICQITKSTWQILQDPEGESKEFLFNKIRQKDLKNPSIAIPAAIRWLAHKRQLAVGKVEGEITHEHIILQYKGLLKSTTLYKDSALKNYREKYAKLKQ